MKKAKIISLFLICLFICASLFSCTKGSELPNGFFDNSKDKMQEEAQKPNDDRGLNDKVQSAESTASDKDKGETKADKTKDTEKAEESKDSDKKDEEKTPVHIVEEKKELSDNEKKEIISRYRDAEDFYYDILLQNFELDNMDVVTLKSDGYETDYHRVILEDVNSLSELRERYAMYFTASFISSVDFSAYCEENDKLYCAATAGSTSQTFKGAFELSVETVSETSARVIRKSESGTQKISAIKRNGTWFFESVGVR